MNSVVSRLFYILFAIAVLVYIIYQFFFRSGSSVLTEQAIAYTSNETLSAQAYIIRDETIVSRNYDGVLSYTVSNGGHIENGGTLANVYTDSTCIATQNRIDELNRQIQNLEALSHSDKTSVVTDLDSIDAQIEDQLIKMLNSVEMGEISSETEVEDDYFKLLYRRMVTIGHTGDFAQEIEKLTKERNQLQKSMGKAADSILSPASGYFVSSVDGYENILTTDIIETLTPNYFSKLKPEKTETSDAVIGKIINGFRCYIAAEMDFESSLRFSVGSSYNIEIPVSSTGIVPASVAYITKDAAKDQAVIVFKCSYMDAGIVSARTQPIKIILNEYKGLRISSSSVRTVDGVQGVYVLEANMVKFKPIQKVYAGNGYMICKRAKTSAEGLFLYDDVIVKGKDLYDGKSIKR